jgi:hypothetical protein
VAADRLEETSQVSGLGEIVGDVERRDFLLQVGDRRDHHDGDRRQLGVLQELLAKLPAVRTSYPSCWRTKVRASRTAISSSTIRMPLRGEAMRYLVKTDAVRFLSRCILNQDQAQPFLGMAGDSPCSQE